jgi:hypothetical protein
LRASFIFLFLSIAFTSSARIFHQDHDHLSARTLPACITSAPAGVNVLTTRHQSFCFRIAEERVRSFNLVFLEISSRIFRQFYTEYLLQSTLSS